ncbi:hypothetical protein [Actinoplanes sp. NPDC051851]|uniref:hypothetical protein n=1 Tax=Actinoplanes sp. NPDC051851 TaxID=3154753 RepID=UPI00341BA753
MARIGAIALVLSASACTASGTDGGLKPGPSAAVPSAAPAGAAAPATTATATAAGIAPVGTGAPVKADRQLLFATVRSGGRKMLTVASSGLVELTDHQNDRALFVPSPTTVGGDEYLLKTAKIITGGEAWCLQVHSPGGTRSLQLKTAACDTSVKDQIFTFPVADDGTGRLIEVNGLLVRVTDDGEVIAEESGEGLDLTGFTVRDQGESTIPHLGD